MVISEAMKADSGRGSSGKRSRRSNRETRLAVISLAKFSSRARDSSDALVSLSLATEISMPRLRLVAGWDSSRYAEKSEWAEIGELVGSAVPVFELIVSMLSQGRPKRVATRWTVSAGFNGRIAR
jgi:hypothetical protein